MKTFLFRNNAEEYITQWLDKDTFIFCFGDRRFKDEDNDVYFIHCEYHVTENEFVFEALFEDDRINLSQGQETTYLTKDEIKNIKRIIYAIVYRDKNAISCDINS